MERNVEPPHHSKANIIKAIIIVILFGVSLLLLWRDRVNRPVVNEPIKVEESTVLTKTIKESTDYTDIDAQIPQFANASSAFNKKIEQNIRERIAEHKTETAENWQARFDTQEPGGDLPKTPVNADRMYFNATFDAPEQNNSQYISILVRFAGYTGGAHGYEDIVAYNYDVKNKREITLADLFKNSPNYLNQISEICRNILIKRFTDGFVPSFEEGLKADKERVAYVKESIEPMVYDGTDPKNADNFANFTFTADKLIIHFGQYQVAPYVVGLQDVEMPLTLFDSPI
jgi:hypothetical protein